jgi:hypothetical protein
MSAANVAQPWVGEGRNAAVEQFGMHPEAV